MATGTGALPTLFDLTSRMNGKEDLIQVVEMLSQSNDVLKVLPMKEATEIGGHEFGFRTSIPAGTWRQYNMGVPYGKSTSAKARVGLGSLHGYSLIDKEMADDSGDAVGFRESEDAAWLEGMGQTLVQCFWYGNTVQTPAEYMGLAPFYNTVNTANAQNAASVIDCGGTGTSNASLWLLGLGDRTIFGLYPRGSDAGLHHEDKGDVIPATDALGNRFEAYTSHYSARMGLCPMDWRYGVRAANIDTTNAGLAGPNAIDIFATMAQMVMFTPTGTQQTSGITSSDAPRGDPSVKFSFFCNRTVRHWMDIQSFRDRNVLLDVKDFAGQAVQAYRGVPVRISDQLLNTEARVV